MHHITNRCVGHQDKSISGIVKVSFLQKWKHHRISQILINSAFQCGSFLWLLPTKGHKSTRTIVQASLGLFAFARAFWCRDATTCEPGALPSPGSAGLLWLVWRLMKPSTALQQHLFQNPQTWKNSDSTYSPPFSFISTSTYSSICFSTLSSLNNRSSILYYINIDLL